MVVSARAVLAGHWRQRTQRAASCLPETVSCSLWLGRQAPYSLFFSTKNGIRLCVWWRRRKHGSPTSARKVSEEVKRGAEILSYSICVGCIREVQQSCHTVSVYDDSYCMSVCRTMHRFCSVLYGGRGAPGHEEWATAGGKAKAAGSWSQPLPTGTCPPVANAPGSMNATAPRPTAPPVAGRSPMYSPGPPQTPAPRQVSAAAPKPPPPFL